MKTEELKKDEEYLDKCFPKGEKFSHRGDAMVLLALSRQEGQQQAHTEEVEFLKDIIKGRYYNKMINGRFIVKDKIQERIKMLEEKRKWY